MKLGSNITLIIYSSILNKLMNRFFFTGQATPIENSEFDDEYTVKVPTEDEIRIVAIRLRNCTLFL